MATYQTAAVSKGFTTRDLTGKTQIRVAQYSLTAALALNDVIEMVPVYKGERVVSVKLVAPDLDSNGSPAILLSVGDGGSATRYISSSNIGQAGGQASDTAGVPYTYTADDTIDVKVSTGPATGATSGTVTLIVTLA